MFSEAILNLSRYFKITHAKSGEIISASLLIDGQIKKLSPRISFKIITDILSLNEDQTTIIKTNLPDFIEQFNEFVDNSTIYLRDMRA